MTVASSRNTEDRSRSKSIKQLSLVGWPPSALLSGVGTTSIFPAFVFLPGCLPLPLLTSSIANNCATPTPAHSLTMLFLYLSVIVVPLLASSVSALVPPHGHGPDDTSQVVIYGGKATSLDPDSVPLLLVTGNL